MAKYAKASSVCSSGEHWDFGAVPLQEHQKFNHLPQKTNTTEPLLQILAHIEGDWFIKYRYDLKLFIKAFLNKIVKYL